MLATAFKGTEPPDEVGTGRFSSVCMSRRESSDNDTWIGTEGTLVNVHDGTDTALLHVATQKVDQPWLRFDGVQFPKDDPEAWNQATRARYQEFDTIPNAQLESDAAARLADRIGPTVALTNSAGGLRALLTALKTEQIKGIVAYENVGYVYPAGEGPGGEQGPFGPIEVPLEEFRKLIYLCLVKVRDGFQIRCPIAILHEESLIVFEQIWRTDGRIVQPVGVVVRHHRSDPLFEIGRRDNPAGGV